MPLIKTWFEVSENYDIFNIYESKGEMYDGKVTDKFIKKFTKLIELLEAMQTHLHIKRTKRMEKEER